MNACRSSTIDPLEVYVPRGVVSELVHTFYSVGTVMCLVYFSSYIPSKCVTPVSSTHTVGGQVIHAMFDTIRSPPAVPRRTSLVLTTRALS